MLSKLLILEGSWANDSGKYISDTLSTTRVYSALEALLWIHGTPIRVIQRPLLAARFVDDLHQFTNLKCNQAGLSIVVLTAHGSKTARRKHRSKGHVFTRTLEAIDGELNLSAKVRQLHGELSRTVLILDACGLGAHLKSFLDASGALGVVGFSKDVDWIDSSTFVLAALLKFHENDVLTKRQTKRAARAAQQVLRELKKGAFESLWTALGVEFRFSA